MKFITDKIEWTEAMKDSAEELVGLKLSRLVDNWKDATVTLKKLNKDKIKVALSLDLFRAQEVGTDFYSVMSKVASTLKQIIRNHKKKYVDKKRNLQIDMYEFLPEEEDEYDITDYVSKEKIFDLKPTTLEISLEEFEQTDYPFYVFKDAKDNNTITIIYRRFDDTYGIIRCH